MIGGFDLLRLSPTMANLPIPPHDDDNDNNRELFTVPQLLQQGTPMTKVTERGGDGERYSVYAWVAV
jgi:hypothetical protein